MGTIGTHWSMVQPNAIRVSWPNNYLAGAGPLASDDPILYWLTILLANSQQKMPQNPESGNSDETLKPSLARETV
ncbi:hypothetical protein BST95_13510 [Halioglobus japonicus]|nr:hypothetical protein BST95_13510 [Halioglobus japonicus]